MLAPCFCLLLVGCGSINFHGADEDRNLAAQHVPGSAIDVHTDVGSVEIVADLTVNEVKVTAKVTARGKTEEEAKSRLKDAKVTVNRRDDGVLAIAAEAPKDWLSANGSCSFVIRVPDANGCKVRTGNGSVSIKELGGEADVHTGVGSLTVANHRGKVTAETGNGSVQVSKVAGDVRTKTAVGSMTIREIDGAVTAESGNGSLTVGKVKGAVNSKTSVGQVTLEEIDGNVEAKSGNGSMSLAPAAGSNSSFHLKTAVGAVTVRLPASAGGSVEAGTAVGNVTINGARKPTSVTGDRTSKQVVITENGPASKIHSGNGSITITLN
jgi:hypothetical protein